MDRDVASGPRSRAGATGALRLQDRNRGGCTGRLVMTPPKVIALEEHFTSAKLRALRGKKDMPVKRKLDDRGELRIREMDEAGIDLQVISGNNPTTQNLDAETAVRTRACLQRCSVRSRAPAPGPLCRLCYFADSRSESGGRRARARREQAWFHGRHDHETDPRPLHGRQTIAPDL
jgi:hypothetical protein